MWPRSIELKALEKSTRRAQRDSGRIEELFKREAKECTMGSQPAGIPTPTWRGERISTASDCTARATHFVFRHRKTSPIAMGRSPPSFFWQAIREALHRKGIMHLGAHPAESRLTIPTRPLRANSARIGEGQKTVSFRWLALRHEGPGAVPLGNDFKALTTSNSDM